MLNTEFRGNRPAGSEKEDFLNVFPYMGVWQSWSCDQNHMVIVPGSYQQIKMQNLVTNGPGVSEKIMF